MGGLITCGAGGSTGQLLQLAENWCLILCVVWPGQPGGGRSVITLYLISWEGGTRPPPLTWSPPPRVA